jgi:hypothetical protein
MPIYPSARPFIVMIAIIPVSRVSLLHCLHHEKVLYHEKVINAGFSANGNSK